MKTQIFLELKREKDMQQKELTLYRYGNIVLIFLRNDSSSTRQGWQKPKSIRFISLWLFPVTKHNAWWLKVQGSGLFDDCKIDLGLWKIFKIATMNNKKSWWWTSNYSLWFIFLLDFWFKTNFWKKSKYVYTLQHNLKQVFNLTLNYLL